MALGLQRLLGRLKNVNWSIKMNRVRILLLIACLIKTSFALAWGDLGHQTVGEIAERNLTPQARQGIINILGAERLAQAATWPDAVRDDHDFDPFKDFHFMEIPTGKTYQTLSADERAERDAYTVLTKYPALLKDPNVSRNVKMIALRYIIHVTGDVHQPLHVGNGVDMGANLCQVLWSDRSKKPKNLHSIWDSTLVEETAKPLAATHNPPVKYYSYADFATDLMTAYPVTTEQIKKIQDANTFDWVKESQDLRPLVYPDDSDKYTDTTRPYCKIVTGWKTEKDPSTGQVFKKAIIENGTFDSEKLPTLSDEYKAKAKTIVANQIIKGGLRLAQMLNGIFGNTTGGETADQIRKQLLIKN